LPRLAAIIVASVLFGTVYVVAQQVDRLSANDAPLRLASQVAAELREGQTTTLDVQPHVDLSRSLAPFVVVEDAQGSPTDGSGFLKGSLVSLPTGVLGSAARNGEDDVTWQPQSRLRFATVTLKVGNQFVTAGQSLMPSEDRVGTVQLLVGAGWLVSMLVLWGTWFWLYRVRLGLQRQFAAQSPVPRSSE
jgi:branched-subunit amino acid ABC-type transport system permease component